MDIGRLVGRLVIGGLFVGHGTQKLFGWFGGPGLTGTEQMMGALEMRPTPGQTPSLRVSPKRRAVPC
jgi:putative oxidoreductase